MKLLRAPFLAVSSMLFVAVSAQGQTVWRGSATVHGQQVPITLELKGSGSKLTGTLINGPERSPASTTTRAGQHITLTFADYARTLELDEAAGALTGSFGTKTVRYPLTLARSRSTPRTPVATPQILGDWEIATHSAKGESAWQLHVDQSSAGLHAVIQRIDGDTGSLFAESATDGSVLFSHLSPAGPALYTLTPKDDGTLLVSNLLRADLGAKADQQNLVARRPAAARAANLAAPTPPAEQTRMKNPNDRLAFSAPDLSGHIVSNTDPQFDGKVVLVTVGGSWCPNCHDEAPDLEVLYKKLHSRGLEIVNLSFEEDDQLKDPARLRAFIASTGITYTVLLAGVPDQLNEKLPQAENLNCWPTSFLVDRTGHVREIHAGFSGPATGQAHTDLVREITADVEHLLAEPVPTQSASLRR
ncbi:Peroxiredoxin [Granulicella rosea]|uniref:Peroxiredoxin n=1 Tax=Granulicella rosea TaxID=474952 RepID=A0A239E825_9BACT|nr:TlpA disulfide reductase family protein [Granulicella rosea]SNS40034.1 Peroxiredoxin [Granulicella rosea]